MSSDRSAYNLTHAQLQQTLEALDRARATFQVKPRTQRLYKLLRLCVYTGVVTLVAIVPVTIFMATRTTAEDFGTTLTATFVLYMAIAVVFVAAVLGSPILLLLNLPLILRILRQRALLRRLGLKDLSISLWKTERKKGIWKRIWVGFVIATGLIIMMGPPAMLTSAENTDELKRLAVFAVFYLAFGISIFAQYFVQRGKEQIDLVADADQMRRLLLRLRGEADVDQPIAVPAEAVERMARIESAQIARERVQAVAAGLERASHGYAVQIARDVSTRKAALDLASRMKVEELIERVGANPRPPEATEAGPEGLRQLKTAEGEFEIVYGIDEPQRQVRLVALRQPQGDISAGSKPPGSSRA